MSWELCVNPAERRAVKQPEGHPACIDMLLLRQGCHIIIEDLHGKRANSLVEYLMPRSGSLNYLCEKLSTYVYKAAQAAGSSEVHTFRDSEF